MELNKNWEVVKETLMNNGLNHSQANSRAAKVTYAICSKNPDLLKLFDTEKEIDKAEKRLNEIKQEIEDKTQELTKKKEINKNVEDKAQKTLDKVKDYIDNFNKAVKECETAEGRDTLKVAQMFVNSVEIQNAQNNTAFINGLACILSNGKSGFLFGGFKRITPDEFETDANTMRYGYNDDSKKNKSGWGW